MPRRAASRSASSASPREAELAALLAAREGQLQSERARAADLERALAERDSQHRQRLDEQTALADVLRIISQSPADLQSVLDAIVTSAARLWQADEARVRRLEGEWLVPAAGFGDASAERGNLPVPGDRSSIAGPAGT